MELFRGTAPTVKFYLPTPTTIVTNIEYALNGVPQGTLTVPPPVSGAISVTLPYILYDGQITITWSMEISGQTVVETTYYDIVTPLLTKREVDAIYAPATITDDEYKSIERAVRLIIQAHTGQVFGLAKKTLTIEGHGDRALRLPERLIELTGISTQTAVLNHNVAIIVSDGWYLKKGWAEVLSTLTTDNLYFTGSESTNAAPGEPGYEKPSHGAVISAPGVVASPTKWLDDYPFKISGMWGYTHVPIAVQEAARLLINDYACMEIAYRDRYLESMKAADWRMQFSSRSWEYTGNVRADQLLSEYVLFDWAAI